MTQDKVTFRDLLGRVGYSSAPGVINIFSSLEQVCVCMKWPSPSPAPSPTGEALSETHHVWLCLTQDSSSHFLVSQWQLPERGWWIVVACAFVCVHVHGRGEEEQEERKKESIWVPILYLPPRKYWPEPNCWSEWRLPSFLERRTNTSATFPTFSVSHLLYPLPVPTYLQCVVERTGTWWLNCHLSKQQSFYFKVLLLHCREAVRVPEVPAAPTHLCGGVPQFSCALAQVLSPSSHGFLAGHCGWAGEEEAVFESFVYLITLVDFCSSLLLVIWREIWPQNWPIIRHSQERGCSCLCRPANCWTQLSLCQLSSCHTFSCEWDS